MQLPHEAWRRGALLFCAGAAATLALNLALALWSVAGGTDGVFADGDCGRIRTVNVGMHALINGLGTVLLAGSNYCMQCVSAPTRAQVDGAHARRRWLDLGVMSVRNLGAVGWRNVAVWLLLGASSLPLHLLYNSAVYASRSANEYRLYRFNEAWVASTNLSEFGCWGLSGPEVDCWAPQHSLVVGGKTGFERLDPAACIDAYSVPFQSTRSGIFLIVEGSGDDGWANFGYVGTGVIRLSDGDGCGSTQSYQWVCNQYPNATEFCKEKPCDEVLPTVRANPLDWHPFGSLPVKYCLSLPSREHCKLRVSPVLLWVVVGLNLFKAALMWIIYSSRLQEKPILTVGDAVSSFLQHPDRSSQDMCLLSKDDAATFWARLEEPPNAFKQRRRRRFVAASSRR